MATKTHTHTHIMKSHQSIGAAVLRIVGADKETIVLCSYRDKVPVRVCRRAAAMFGLSWQPHFTTT